MWAAYYKEDRLKKQMWVLYLRTVETFIRMCKEAMLEQSQAPDVLPPPLHQAVPFRIAAFVLNAAPAECEFVLGVNKRRGCLRISPVNPTRPQHAISDN